MLKCSIVVLSAILLWSLIGKIFDYVYGRSQRKKSSTANAASSSKEQRDTTIGRDLAYSYPHAGCGGTMVPTQYGWTCTKCLHRFVDYSRRPPSEKDKPLEGPFVPCD